MANVIAEVLTTAKEQLDEAINRAKETLTEMSDIIERIEKSDVITEVENARGTSTTLGDRLDGIDSEIETNKKYIQITNPKEDNKYGIELLNFSGQGRPLDENSSSKGLVVHNYTDAEAVVIDNVGEAPTLRLGGCRNATRREDKPENYCARPNPIQVVQAFMNDDGKTHSNHTMFNMDWAGNLWYRSKKPTETKGPQILSATQELAESGFYAMTLGSFYETKYLLNIVYANGKSALKVYRDGAGQTILQTTDSGLKHIAYKGDMFIQSTEGNVVLKAGKNILAQINGTTNVPICRFVSVPTSSNAIGEKGDISADDNYLYICKNTNSWIRIAKDNTGW